MSAFVVLDARGRQAVPSLHPFLPLSKGTESFMDAAVMSAEDVTACRWVGFTFGKGLTSPRHGMSVFGVPGKSGSGWHAELVKGLPTVDPSPLCYQADHKLGFDDFVRWVYFAAPADEGDVFGVDFSLLERPTAGVADSVVRVADVAKHALRHGIPGHVELALLNPRMIEEAPIADFRKGLGLHSVSDWAAKAAELFAEGGTRCTKCGLDTRHPPFRFCFRCGYRFAAA